MKRSGIRHRQPVICAVSTGVLWAGTAKDGALEASKIYHRPNYPLISTPCTGAVSRLCARVYLARVLFSLLLLDIALLIDC